MKNKKLIENKIKQLGCTLGCWDDQIELVNKKYLNKIIENLEYEYTDIEIKIGRKKYYVEICTVDNEKDLSVLSKEEYKNRYGEN